MASFLVALSTWLHTLATIVMVGYFIFTGLVFLPVFQGQMQANALRDLLERVSARLRPFLAARCSFFWSPVPASC